jgi:hypothetical protein
MRTSVRCVGLLWTERCVARNWFAGHYGACINTIGCGAKRGMWLHGDSSAFTTPEAAMDAADRHVTAYIDSRAWTELRHPDTPP